MVQRLLKIYQGCNFSPNLVTLIREYENWLIVSRERQAQTLRVMIVKYRNTFCDESEIRQRVKIKAVMSTQEAKIDSKIQKGENEARYRQID